MVLNETYPLANGVQVPKLGLGTWFIDDAVSLREAPDERHERDCRGKGDGEDQQVVYPRLHAAQYTAFSHTAWI